MNKIKTFVTPMNAVLILIGLAFIGYMAFALSLPSPINDLSNIPPQATMEYRTVENTGLLGRAEYYLFDSQGNRYYVTQRLFDSFPNLPKR